MKNIVQIGVMKVAVIGASRGLGRELCLQMKDQVEVWAVSRKIAPLKELSQVMGRSFTYVSFDITKERDISALFLSLDQFHPDKIMMTVGGGPYGPFEKRDFKDHEWAMQVTYTIQAHVAHWCLSKPRKPQLIVVGSSVAEDKADPGAASYSAAKHALVGLHKNLRIEHPEWDFRLVSPGYMDTPMLPAGSSVRQEGPIWNPSDVAKDIWEWSLQPASTTTQWHKTYPPRPVAAK